MKLEALELRQLLPSLYSQEHVSDPMCWAKFFTPDGQWTWYAIEFDGKDQAADSVDLSVTVLPYADRRKSSYGGVKPEEYVDWFMPPQTCRHTIVMSLVPVAATSPDCNVNFSQPLAVRASSPVL